MSAMRTDIEQILDEFGSPERPKFAPVPKQKVLNWMGSQNLDALGALYAYMFSEPYRGRITPSLQLEEYFGYLLNYWQRCFLEDPDSNWACSRYEAGWDLVKWFNSFWNDHTVPRACLQEIKRMLEELYKGGGDELRRCLVNATLEHLFENPKVAGYFADWKEDPLLGEAYNDALMWSKKGGTSPLMP